jgi:mono/diheme cytochrome c family protein
MRYPIIFSVAVALIICAVAQAAETAETAKETAKESAEITYTKDIQPILMDRCVSCHGAEKQKGELRLDSIAAINKGGKNGQVLVAGEPAQSPLYTLTILPKGDNDIMPAKGEPLTQQQTDLIREWIARGAHFDAVKNDAPVPAAPINSPHVISPTDIDLRSEKISKPDAALIKALQEMGAIIVPLSSNKAALDVDLSHATRALDSTMMTMIERLADHIFWLDVQNTTLNDEHLAIIARCKNLTRVHLNKTQITSAGLASLAHCSELVYVNLIGTAVDDSGLMLLAPLKKLERIYSKDSHITASGIQKFQAENPRVRVISGLTGLPTVIPERLLQDKKSDEKKKREKQK